MSTYSWMLFPTTATIATDIDAPMHALPHCDNMDDDTSRNIDNDDGDLKRPHGPVRHLKDRNVHKIYRSSTWTYSNTEHSKKARYFSQKSIEQFGGDPTNVIHHWSYVTQRVLQGTMEQLEYNYRKSRHRHQKVTFFGYLPESNIYNRWQDRERTKHRNRHRKPKKNIVQPLNQQEDTKNAKKHVWNKNTP